MKLLDGNASNAAPRTASIEPASIAVTLARLAELASMRAAIASEEAKHFAVLVEIAEMHLAGCAAQSVTPTVPLPPANNATAPVTDASLLDKRGVAAFLDCSARTVRRMELAGELPEPVRVGRLLRWRRADLEQLAQSKSSARRRDSA